MKEKFYAFIVDLQNTITSTLEKVDRKAMLKRMLGKENKAVEISPRVIENGAVFEKSGVHISAVHEPPPAAARSYYKIVDVEHYATGLSICILKV